MDFTITITHDDNDVTTISLWITDSILEIPWMQVFKSSAQRHNSICLFPAFICFESGAFGGLISMQISL